MNNRTITNDDIKGYTGFASKWGNECVFEQNKCVERGPLDHDSYEKYCTKSGTLKPCFSFVCNKCDQKITIDEYKERLNR